MRSRIEVRTSAIHGHGVFARRRLRRGSYIGTFQGRRTQTDGPHVLWVILEDGTQSGVVGENELRYLNHSRLANAEFWGADLFAVRNIQPGQEVTLHYGDDWSDVP